MTPHALLAEVDPSWLSPEDPATDGSEGSSGFPAELRERAATSVLGRRLLLGLLAEQAPRLLAPAAPGRFAQAADPWSRARLEALELDLGGLAYAPAIRAEIGRDPVRRLKRLLGEGYLLALEPTVWNAEVDGITDVRLAKQLGASLAQADDGVDASLRALFSRQGRGELRAWADQQHPALAEWSRLLHPRVAQAGDAAAHLPATAVARVHAYHARRAGA